MSEALPDPTCFLGLPEEKVEYYAEIVQLSDTDVIASFLRTNIHNSYVIVS